MKKGIAKHTAFCLAMGLVFSQAGVTAMAAGGDIGLVGLSSTTRRLTEEELQAKAAAVQEETQAAAEQPQEVIPIDVAPEAVVQETEAAEQSETPEAAPVELSDEHVEAQSIEEGGEGIDTSMVGTTGFAQCEEYLNIRTDASADSEAVGKIYNNGSLEILGVAPGGWYQVRSGNAEGYVKADYVATGEEAQAIADTSGYTTAQTAVDGLNVRADASTDAAIMATIDDSHEMEVVEDQGDWVKVLIDGEMYGYVSADYVNTTTEYATGETLEEEEERLNQEWLAYLAEQEAIQAAAEAAYQASLEEQSYYESAQTYTDNSSYSEPSYTYTEPSVSTSGSADELASQAASLYEDYLRAQDAADAAVANGDGEQAIMDTAAAAVSAYETYLSAQNAADAAAAGMSVESTTSAETGSTAETTQTAAAEAPAEETTNEETYEAPAETPAEETPAPAPATSSAGQAIADYAVQFVGNPYVYGGASLTGGADCSGFTMAVMANFGIGLPHNAAAQSGCGTPVSLDALQPGDLLFYDGGGGIGHVSIYIGGGQVVHASNPTNGILISSIGYRTPVAARRFV